MNKKWININTHTQQKLSINVYILKQNTLQSKMNLLYLVYVKKRNINKSTFGMYEMALKNTINKHIQLT